METDRPRAGGEATAQPVIDVRHLEMRYRIPGSFVTALEGITLSAGAGEFVTLVGPSGCGKTTLLRIVAGLIRHTGGEVEVNGRPLRGPTRDIGIVFQVPALMGWRSVLDNILLQIEIRRLDVREYRSRALELIKLVGLSGFQDRYPYQLSGGMQQRVAICRALIHDPSLLLMDEPFGALDALTREQMNRELQRIWLERRKTVLFITHSIPEAVFLSDRVCVMSARPGRILETLEIPIPRPRNAATMQTTTFVNLVGRVRDIMQASGGFD